MALLGIEGLKDASFRGDERWRRASKWCGYASWFVLAIFFLSVVEIALGAVWIASLKTALNFGQVVQPILIPGLALFNSVPSLHLHVLGRVNPPRMALWFSSILSLCHLVSALLFLGACVNNHSHGPLQRTECPDETGGNRSIWDAMVPLQLISGVLYGSVAVMAWKVKVMLENRELRIQEGTEMVDPVEKERRESEARERWKYISAG